MNFEHIENEWPLFYMFMMIDAMFEDDQDQVFIYLLIYLSIHFSFSYIFMMTKCFI